MLVKIVCYYQFQVKGFCLELCNVRMLENYFLGELVRVRDLYQDVLKVLFWVIFGIGMGCILCFVCLDNLYLEVR